jgi:hypothetical protein
MLLKITSEGAENFPKDLPERFQKAGKVSVADIGNLIGNYMDLKITDRTSSWENDIKNIVNTEIAKVPMHCGQEYATQMHEMNMNIDERSNFAKRIDEQGIAKAVQTWSLDQASVVLGENKVDKLKRQGIVGGMSDEEVAKRDGNVAGAYTVADFGEAAIQSALDGDKAKLAGKTFALFIKEKEGEFKIVTFKIESEKVSDIKSAAYDPKVHLPSETLLRLMVGKTENKGELE